MKKIFLALIGFTSLVLTGCFDTVEEITISQNGTGVYKMSADMSGLMEFIDMMAAMDTSSNSQLKAISGKELDSVVYLKSIVDTSTTLTAEQKSLLREAVMNIKVSDKQKVFKMDMTYPFKKVGDIQKIYTLNASGKGFGGLGADKENSALGGLTDGMPSPGEMYQMNFSEGLIERKVDSLKIAALKKDEKFRELEGAGEMLEGITFQTKINLPRPAKKVTGESVKLSEDKKSVTLKTNLKDLFTRPGFLNYRIEY